MRAFEAIGFRPTVALSATDADVIKAYVAQGLGIIAMLPAVAYDPDRDRGIQAADASYVFKPTFNRVEIRRNYYLRGYRYDFIQLFAPNWSRAAVQEAMQAQSARMH